MEDRQDRSSTARHHSLGDGRDPARHGHLAQPVVPGAAAKLLDLLAVPDDARRFTATGEAGRLQSGTPLPAPLPIFPRYVEPEAEDAAKGAS